MGAPESFDRKAILSLVNRLYASAHRLPGLYGLSGLFIGLLSGFAANPIPSGYGVWLIPLLLGCLGAGLGRSRGKIASFELKLRAQQALCSLDMTSGIRRLEEHSDNFSAPEKDRDGDS